MIRARILAPLTRSLKTRIGYPERLRDPTGSVNVQSTASGRNYRANKQLIEGIFGGWFYERSCEPKTIEAHHGWRDFASNTHLHGDVRCRALLRGVKSAVAKTLLSMPDLRYRAMAEIRKQPGCHDVQGIAINRVTDERTENNWSLCVLSAGAADAKPRLAPRSMSKAFCAAIMI